MSGRFFTAPLFAAVVTLSTQKDIFKPNWLSFAAIILLGLSSPRSPIFSDAEYGQHLSPIIDSKGISDERAFYYPQAGLLRANRVGDMPDHSWVAWGKEVRENGPPVLITAPIGYLGFYAGPKIQIIDLYALADPLLARLPMTSFDTHLVSFYPMISGQRWRIGHFRRPLPEGYLATRISGTNKIRDKNLAAYYEKLSLITQSELFDTTRLTEIWRLHTEQYDVLLEKYTEDSFEEYQINDIDNYDLWRSLAQHKRISVLAVELGDQLHSSEMHIIFSPLSGRSEPEKLNLQDDKIDIIFFQDNSPRGSITVPSPPEIPLQENSFTLQIPISIATKGYNRVKIYPNKFDYLPETIHYIREINFGF